MAACIPASGSAESCVICRTGFESSADSPMIHEGSKHPPIHRSCWRTWSRESSNCPLCRQPIDRSTLFSWSDEFWIRAKRVAGEAAVLAVCGTAAQWLSKEPHDELTTFALSYLIHDQLWMVQEKYLSRARWTWAAIPWCLFPKQIPSMIAGLLACEALEVFKEPQTPDLWRRMSSRLGVIVAAKITSDYPFPIPPLIGATVAAVCSFFRHGIES